jgi:hypothetical protein
MTGIFPFASIYIVNRKGAKDANAFMLQPEKTIILPGAFSRFAFWR